MLEWSAEAFNYNYGFVHFSFHLSAYIYLFSRLLRYPCVRESEHCLTTIPWGRGLEWNVSSPFSPINTAKGAVFPIAVWIEFVKYCQKDFCSLSPPFPESFVYQDRLAWKICVSGSNLVAFAAPFFGRQ